MKKIGRWWLPDAEEQMRTEIERHGMWHPHRIGVAIEYLRSQNKLPLRTSIDCGAHVGMWSLVLAKHSSHVVSIEPSEETFRCLVRNVEEADPKLGERINAINAAVGDHIGEVTPYTDDRYGDANSGGNFMLESPNKQNRQVGAPVALLTIDSLKLTDVDFIKIDVEGMEPYVLRGARRTIVKCRPFIIWENKKVFAKRYGWPEGLPQRILTKLGAERLVPETEGKDELWGFK